MDEDDFVSLPDAPTATCIQVIGRWATCWECGAGHELLLTGPQLMVASLLDLQATYADWTLWKEQHEHDQ